ncbi:hypothetical protein [Gordonia sp. (in: high G+C Gram-positive bacteria)]|uniref:hypothetical protein n=1 Tax=Gordonia sp. (in: high G+C Gram-positive bacteria) TaxID=84139 RepID=UPI003527F3DA
MTNSIASSTPIDRDRLGVVEPPLGSGGQGKVYRIAATFDGRALVYKEYSAAARTELDRAALNALVAYLSNADATRRAALLATFAWPIAPVTSGGATVGFVMAAAPHVFMSERSRGPAGARRLNEIQHLLNAPAFVARLGFRLSRRTQIEVLISVATALRTLHDAGFAFGDLSPRNLLFDPDGGEIFVLDCDAITRPGLRVLPQAETPGWHLPAGELTGTAAGDDYKFGLLVLRLLAGDQHTTSPAALPSEFTALRPLLIRSLTDAPAERPSAATWISVLRDVLPGAPTATLTPTISSPTVPSTSTPPSAAASNVPATTRTATAPAPPGVKPRSKAGLLWIAGAAALLVLAIVGAHAASKSSHSATTPSNTPAASGESTSSVPTTPRAAAEVPDDDISLTCGTTPFQYTPDASTTLPVTMHIRVLKPGMTNFAQQPMSCNLAKAVVDAFNDPGECATDSVLSSWCARRKEGQPLSFSDDDGGRAIVLDPETRDTLSAICSDQSSAYPSGGPEISVDCVIFRRRPGSPEFTTTHETFWLYY